MAPSIFIKQSVIAILLLCALPASATVVVGPTASAPNTVTNGGTVASPGINDSGFSFIAIIVTDLGSSSPGVLTDNKVGNTMVLDTSLSSGNPRIRVYHCLPVQTGTSTSLHTFTYTGTATYCSIVVISAVGTLPPTRDIMVAKASTTAATSATAPTATPIQSNELVITVVNGVLSGAPTTPSGFTTVASLPYVPSKSLATGVGYIIPSTISPITPTWGFSGSNDYTVATISWILDTGTSPTSSSTGGFFMLLNN